MTRSGQSGVHLRRVPYPETEPRDAEAAFDFFIQAYGQGNESRLTRLDPEH